MRERGTRGDTARHNIAPVYDGNSRVLILGSFPSVASRASGFFYGHPQNRFWRVMAALLSADVPQTVEEKRAFLLANHIALWDVIASCDIAGSSDASIRNAVPNDLTPILETASIRQIFTNGGTAHRLYRKYIYPLTGREDAVLPSTSPANAARSLDALINAWQPVCEALEE